MSDGSLIPGFPNVTTLLERVEKYYAKRPVQFSLSEYEDSESMMTPAVSKYAAQYVNMGESPERRRAL